MAKSIKAFLFDLDGVIVDTAKYHFLAWRKLANELGFDFDEVKNEQLKGVSRMESLDKILKWGGVSLSDEEKTIWAARKNEWYLELITHMNPDEILEGALPFLKATKAAGIKIVLGSASKNAPTILHQVDVTEMFDAIIDGNCVSKSKPDPEVFLLGAEAVNVDPVEAIVFEDASSGIDAAIAGGFYAVGIGKASVLGAAHIVLSDLIGQTPESIIRSVQKN